MKHPKHGESLQIVIIALNIYFREPTDEVLTKQLDPSRSTAMPEDVQKVDVNVTSKNQLLRSHQFAHVKETMKKIVQGTASSDHK